jgi:hypothetical protein
MRGKEQLSVPADSSLIVRFGAGDARGQESSHADFRPHPLTAPIPLSPPRVAHAIVH